MGSYACSMIKTHRLMTGVEVERLTESVVPKTLENVGEWSRGQEKTVMKKDRKTCILIPEKRGSSVETGRQHCEVRVINCQNILATLMTRTETSKLSGCEVGK